MSSSPRLTVVLTEPLLAWLQAEAGRLGVSVSELVRRLLDKARGE